jgi:hypothetical protein
MPAATRVQGVDPGTLEIIAAKDLMVIWPIQRKASDARVRAISQAWDDTKVGIICVAKILDSEYKGRKHIYDGGTRWRSQMETEEGSDVYPFACWVRPMTVHQAAEAFLDANSLAMKPSAFYRYSVGVRADKPPALAIQRALDTLELEASPSRSTFGNGGPGTFAAFAAAERIVSREFAACGDWGSASAVLAWTIAMGRKAYPQHGDEGTAFGHDADLIQSLAVIRSLNPNVADGGERETNLIHATTTWLGEGQIKERLFHTGDLMEPSHWRVCVIDATKGQGGSTSRGQQMGRQIVLNHNQKMRPALKAPPSPR